MYIRVHRNMDIKRPPTPKRLSIRKWIAFLSITGATAAFFVLHFFVLPKQNVLSIDDATFQRDVLASLAKQTALPNEIPWIERVEDADLRRAIQSDFYRNAKNGDAIVHFSDQVLLYRLETKTLLNTFAIATSTNE